MIIMAAIICIVLKRSLVCITAPGRSSGPPKETSRAVPATDRNGGIVALGAILDRKLYNMVAKSADVKVARITINTGMGPEFVEDSVNGMMYCSPSAWVKAKKSRLARTDTMDINKPTQTIFLVRSFCII
jgi:hypothetical protein